MHQFIRLRRFAVNCESSTANDLDPPAVRISPMRIKAWKTTLETRQLMLSAPPTQCYIEKTESSKRITPEIPKTIDLSAPRFVWFEEADDPFSGVIQMLLEYGQYPFERVEVAKGVVVESKGVAINKFPSLQFDGLTLSGFSTICRAIATRVGLDGCSMKESNEIDMIVNFVEAEMERVRPLIQRLRSNEESDDDDVENFSIDRERYDKFEFQLAPILNVRLKSSGSKTVVGKSLTWADYVLVYFMRTLIEYTGGQILDDYPDLAYYYHKNHAL